MPAAGPACGAGGSTPTPSPSPRPELLEVGRIVKVHGLAGEVVVVLTTDRAERLDPGSVLRSSAGELVVRRARPHQRRWIVSFEGVTGRNEAEALKGTTLLAAPIDDSSVLWVDELVGADVVEMATRLLLGRVVAVEANPASDLLVLDSGGLVPLRFVSRREPGAPARLLVEIPPGLLG